MRSRGVLFTGVGQVTLGDVDVPSPEPGEVLVEIDFSVVSPGTELRCLAGKQPGAPAWPFVAGYSAAGRVIETRSESLEVGAEVYVGGTQRCRPARLWGGHVAHAVVAADAAYRLPDGCSLVDAACAHLAGIAMRGVVVTKPRPADRVAVVGLGPIGQLSARLFQIAGAQVIGFDRAAERTALLQTAGVAAREVRGSLSDSVRREWPDGADVVVDATGAPAVLAEALAAARETPWGDTEVHGPRLVIQGSYPSEFSLNYDAAFRKEITIHMPRDCRPSDVRAVLNQIADGRLRVDDLFLVRPADAAPLTYEELRAGRPELLSVAFAWRD